MRIAVGAFLVVVLLTGLPSVVWDAPAGATSSRVGAAKAKKRPASPTPSRDHSAIPPSERVAIQFDLVWTGDYNGLANGEFNDKTIAAIKAFQRNRKFRETGVLNPQERTLLANAAKAMQNQVGWSLLDDPMTGARLGLPAKQVSGKGQTKNGSRWASAQGQVQVETFRIREPGITLAFVHEQQRKEPSTRRLGLNVLRSDFFLLSGTQGLKRFHVRADIRDGEVRGITILYDQATDTIMDPVAVAMAGAFTAFPGASIAGPGPLLGRKVEYGTGIIVSSAGHIVTDRQLTDGCRVVVVSGHGDAERLAEDRTADLALLRLHGASDLVPAALLNDAGKGAELTIVGIADPQNQGGGHAASAVSARLRGDLLEPPPQPGFSGAAVLDPQGQYYGMVELKAASVGAAATGNSAPQATLVPVQTIRAFLDRQRLPAASGRPGVEAAKSSLVRVICVR